MRSKTTFFLPLVMIAGCLLAAQQRSPTSSALDGRVSSDADRSMEGVLVTAKGFGSTISVTVVTDREGKYAFPASKLKPGKYTLSIRATGYELANAPQVEILGVKTIQVDLKLDKTHNLLSQLTNAEILLSIPGTQREKNELYPCANCHSLIPIIQSNYNAEAWQTTLARMKNWSVQSSIAKPIRQPYKVAAKPNPEFAQYLSTINLSSKPKWDYDFKSLPRPAGRATRVIITEYDLPASGRLPHDAILDANGIIWYNDFHEPLIGRLNPRTGETKEWRFPPLKPDFPTGTLSIMLDRNGDLWFPRFLQGGITQFNPRTEKFQTWLEPPEYNTEHSSSPHVSTAADGTVWFTENEGLVISRLDPKSGHISSFPMFPDFRPGGGGSGQFDLNNTKAEGHRTYGLASDSGSNAYFCDIVGGNIGRVDAKTGQVTLFKTPTVNSGPRRLSVDSEDRVWFGEYYANKVGMLDPKTKQFKEWTAPTPWSGPYPAMADKNGDAWTAGMGTDLILRLDPKNGNFTEYLLPTVDANIRWVEVDNSTTPPSVWVAEVHGGKIARIEPLD